MTGSIDVDFTNSLSKDLSRTNSISAYPDDDVLTFNPDVPITNVGISIPGVTEVGDIGLVVSDSANVIPDTGNPSIPIPDPDYTLPDTSKSLDFTPLKIAGETLTTKFPFSVPFDLVDSIKALNVKPAAPKFTINFDKQYFVGGATIELDFSKFEKLAVIIRWGVMILFTMSLIMISRKIIGGNS